MSSRRKSLTVTPRTVSLHQVFDQFNTRFTHPNKERYKKLLLEIDNTACTRTHCDYFATPTVRSRKRAPRCPKYNSEIGLLFKAKCKDLQIKQNQQLFDRFAKRVSSLSKDRALGLASQQLGPHSIQILTNILPHSTQIVDLSANQLADDGIISLSTCLASRVIQLNLRDNKIGMAGFRVLLKVLQNNKSLTKLDIGRNRLSEESVRLESLVRYCPLKRLIVDTCRISNLCLGPCQIHTLNLQNNTLKTLDIIRLEHLSCLNIAGTRWQQMDSLPQCLLEMDASRNSLQSIKQILGRFSNLERLNISNNPLRNQNSLVFPASLTHLDISNCQIKRIAFTEFLNQLNASGNLLNSYSLKDLAALIRSPSCSLRKLQLNACGIQDGGLQVLMEGIHENLILRHVQIRNNLIKQGSIIVQMLRTNKSVDRIELSGNFISLQDEKSIGSGLERNKKLNCKENVREQIVELEELLRLMREERSLQREIRQMEVEKKVVSGSVGMQILRREERHLQD